jgi:pimeloyl-ACP methyl ester carboxylesterase
MRRIAQQEETGTLSDRLARFRRSHAQKQIESGGIAWPYYETGTGDDAILLLHGGGGAGDVLFAYIDALAGAFRVIAPSVPRGITSVDAAIAGLVAILDRERVGVCHVFGHSQGGFLAIALSHRFPTRWCSLTIAASALPSAHHDRLVARHVALLDLTPNFLLRPVARLVLGRLAHLGGNNLTADDRRFLAEFVPFDDAPTLRRWARSSALLQRDYHHRTDDSRPWPGPVLLIESGRDRLTGPADASALRQRYPHARVMYFDTAGHLDVVLRPAPYLAALRGFLSGL